MNEYVTDSPVNPGQLSEEMGVGLRTVGPYDDGTTKVKADVDERTLQQAVDAHVADPDFTLPPSPPTQDEIDRARIRELAAKTRLTESEEREYRGLTVELLVGEEG